MPAVCLTASLTSLACCVLSHPQLLAVLPADGRVMLRLGMTNPPFILEHLKEIATCLSHPCVFSYLHVPVQSGSDAVLSAMNRFAAALPCLCTYDV